MNCAFVVAPEFPFAVYSPFAFVDWSFEGVEMGGLHTAPADETPFGDS
jgi:hypothetical protein